jgi:hypothetical protein
VDITVGEYLIIYGHLSNTDLSLVGRVVTPETVVGYIDSGSQLVHIEIRRGNKILNPLEFMPEDMRNALMIRFPPVGEFYSSPDWTQWLTPLDQPEIIIGGPVIGPRAPQ